MPSNETGPTLPKERNTAASLANVADLKLLRCAFNEDDLCTLLADKLFDCDRGRLELHVTKFAQKLQKMRALFIRLKMSKGEGLAMGEIKVQKQFFHPFLNALIESEGHHVSSTQLALKIALEYKDVTTEIIGKSDFAFSSADFVNGVDDVNSLLEYKPPYGKMMSLSWVAWDQTVFQALQLREMWGRIARDLLSLVSWMGLRAALLLRNHVLSMISHWVMCVSTRAV